MIGTCFKGILSLLFILTLTVIPPHSLSAGQNPKLQYKKIQREIKKRKEALEKTKKKEYSILKELEATNKELYKLKRDIKILRKQLRKTNRGVSYVKKDIKDLSSRLDQQRKWLRRKLQAMQKYGAYGFSKDETAGNIESPAMSLSDHFALILTSRNLPQMVRRWRYLERIAEYESTLMKDYSRNISALKDKETELSGLLKKLRGQRRNLLGKESSLREHKKQKRQILASIRKERDLYKNMISELKESSRKLRRMIEESEKKKYIQKGFSKMKRRLPWPVSGAVALPYGSYRDPQFKTPVFRNGIHIKSRDGEVVRAVFSGKVVYADWFKGYGKVVIINHGEGYHTVYANLSDIFLKKGDIINKGDKIGRVGESGTINAPGLYFEVRFKGKPLNPLQWLKRKYSKRKRS